MNFEINEHLTFVHEAVNEDRKNQIQLKTVKREWWPISANFETHWGHPAFVEEKGFLKIHSFFLRSWGCIAILGAYSGGLEATFWEQEKRQWLDGYLGAHSGRHIVGTAFGHLPVCPFARLPLASEKTMVADERKFRNSRRT